MIFKYKYKYYRVINNDFICTYKWYIYSSIVELKGKTLKEAYQTYLLKQL